MLYLFSCDYGKYDTCNSVYNREIGYNNLPIVLHCTYMLMQRVVCYYSFLRSELTKPAVRIAQHVKSTELTVSKCDEMYFFYGVVAFSTSPSIVGLFPTLSTSFETFWRMFNLNYFWWKNFKIC